MEQFAQIKWTSGTYEEFINNIDDIPAGAICFCTDVKKLFVKVQDESGSSLIPTEEVIETNN